MKESVYTAKLAVSFATLFPLWMWTFMFPFWNRLLLFCLLLCLMADEGNCRLILGAVCLIPIAGFRRREIFCWWWSSSTYLCAGAVYCAMVFICMHICMHLCLCLLCTPGTLVSLWAEKKIINYVKERKRLNLGVYRREVLEDKSQSFLFFFLVFDFSCECVWAKNRGHCLVFFCFESGRRPVILRMMINGRKW